MNKKRLLKLADLLEADAANKKGVKFDLTTWGRSAEDEKLSISCGTAACAMGLAVLSGAFKRAGLTNASEDPNTILPAIGDSVGYAAASDLFDIPPDATIFLFWGQRYPENRLKGAISERFVAKRIRDFVAGKISAP